MKMFIQLKLNTDSFVPEYMAAVGRTISDMACVKGIECHYTFPYVYLDADNKDTKQLLQQITALGWFNDELIDTGELVPYN